MELTPSVPLVCVLDDDASIRRSLERLIRSDGLHVLSFSSVLEFLHGPYTAASCLVVDVQMPGPSGLDLQEFLANAGWTAPIVFITGHANVSMSVRAMRAGAVNFLQKPFEDQELLDSVHQAVERETKARRERRWRAEIAQRFETLTPREREVFHLVVAGLPNKKIAAELGASEKTVKVHRARVMAKMQAPSLADLVHLAHGSPLADLLPEDVGDPPPSPPDAAAEYVRPRSNSLLLDASQIVTDAADERRDERRDESWRRSRATRVSRSSGSS